MNKPFLKWAGGKHKLAPFIARHLPPSRCRLIEPFAGSAALSLALEFEAYLLNDTNPDLIALFQTLKNEKQAFIDYARQYFGADHNQENRFYTLREQFKVPFGRYRTPYFPEKEMQAFIKKADRMEIRCGNFQSALAQVDNHDTIYCDPPYVPLSITASFTAYSKETFNLDEQNRLATAAQQTAPQTQGLLISNHDTALTRELYRSARLETVSVQRNIAAKGSSRQKVGELLAIYGA